MNATYVNGWASPLTRMYAAPTGATLRAIPEMGPGFRGTIHPGRGTHREPVHPHRNGLLYKVGRGQDPKGQYGSLHCKIPLRTHLVPLRLSHRADH